MAAVDYFLKIDGIQGESLDAKHKNEIDVESFSWGETAGAHSPAGGGGAGKVQMQDFHFAMRTSKASPPLLLACASGEHFKQAVLTVRKAGKNQAEFLTFTLTDVLVESYQLAGGTDELPHDQVGLGFARIQVEYKPQKPDGSLGAGVKAGWDVKAGKKL